MYEAIANFINSIIAALQGLAKIGNVASNPIGAIFGTESASQNAEQTEGSKTLPQQETKTQIPIVVSGTSSKRALVTIPENITARFNSTGSPAWRNQPGGKHLGTDFSAPAGSPVFAPYDMVVIKLGHYDDSGRFGDYVMGHIVDGAEYYSGHLQNVTVHSGEHVKAGTMIGETNYLNHTHVQLRIGGQLADFEEYIKTH